MIMKCMKVQTKWFTHGSAQASVNRTQNFNAILDFKSEFEKPMRELLPILSSQFIIMFELADMLVGIYKTHNAIKSINIDPYKLIV